MQILQRLPVQYLVVFIVAVAPLAGQAQTTYYISPDGRDSLSGQTEDAAWKTFEHAFSELQPGDDLVLLNGIYNQENTGFFRVECGDGAPDGRKNAPVTVTAKNERKAWIKGNGSYIPFQLENCEWWNISGLRVSSADNPHPEGREWGSAVWVTGSQHLTFRRMLVHHNNRYFNGGLFMIGSSGYVLVEESEIYYFHRNGFNAFQTHHLTIRRSYANSRGHADLPDGRPSHKISDDGGDRAFLAYYGSHFLVENSISENKNEGFGFISGKETAAGKPSGNRARFYGVISMNDNVPGAVQSRQTDSTSRPIRNVHFKDYLMMGTRRAGFVSRAAKDLTMEYVTAMNINGSAFAANTDRQGQWPSCKAIGGCNFILSNWLIGATSQEVFRSISRNDGHFNFHLKRSWIAGGRPLGINEPVEDDQGQVRNSYRNLQADAQATDCPVLGRKTGSDIPGDRVGARIVYRYVDGRLTDRPLWDPTTGAFPHGAVIDGINDVSGNSLFDVHKRLKVNTEECPLPYTSQARKASRSGG